jgi:hypothetical protein
LPVDTSEKQEKTGVRTLRHSPEILIKDLMNAEYYQPFSRIFDAVLSNATDHSTRIIRMINSRRMRWAGNVARMGRRGMHIGYCWEGQKERGHWEDQDTGGWTILTWILET